jgi:hypothetical protein
MNDQQTEAVKVLFRAIDKLREELLRTTSTYRIRQLKRQIDNLENDIRRIRKWPRIIR